MAQITTIVGLDVAKDKIDACIRSASAKRTFANDAEGHRELLPWLCEHGVGRAVMEATGGYEQSWAKLLDKAGVEVVIVDPSRAAGVEPMARAAGAALLTLDADGMGSLTDAAEVVATVDPVAGIFLDSPAAVRGAPRCREGEDPR